MTREREIQKVTIVGCAGNVALMTCKLIAGIVGHSSAMIADAVHSMSDFVTDIIVLVFVSVSAKPQDSSHDYGHGKFETIATLFIGLALVAAATGIMVSGVLSLIDWAHGVSLEAPGAMALWAALLSIAVKEVLYQYTAYKGKKLNSQAVIANAWHHRSDALSSIAAAIGIGGAILLGDRWTVLDPIASIVVGLFLVKVAVGLLKTSITTCALVALATSSLSRHTFAWMATFRFSRLTTSPAKLSRNSKSVSAKTHTSPCTWNQLNHENIATKREGLFTLFWHFSCNGDKKYLFS